MEDYGKTYGIQKHVIMTICRWLLYFKTTCTYFQKILRVRLVSYTAYI